MSLVNTDPNHVYNRIQSIAPEEVLEAAAENLRRSQRECELKNPKFVADHAKAKLQEFTFVVCGAPRTGKSTLINAIVNKDVAPTKPGPAAVTLETTRYTLEGNCPEQIDETTGEILRESQNFLINIWDTKGITTWDQKLSNIITEKNPMCLIICSSPGSFAKDEFIQPLISQCVASKVFVALVCTNKWNDSDEKRRIVMEEFHHLFEVNFLVFQLFISNIVAIVFFRDLKKKLQKKMKSHFMEILD